MKHASFSLILTFRMHFEKIHVILTMKNGLLAKVFSKCKCLVFDESKIEEIVYLVILDKQ